MEKDTLEKLLEGLTRLSSGGVSTNNKSELREALANFKNDIKHEVIIDVAKALTGKA